MKIISGILKGRNIKGHDIEGTRPTMDRIKESLFAIIQNHIRDSVVLDLFAGSGNLGIEALSNGASYCYFNDLNKKCVNAIKENLSNFSIDDKAKVINMDYNEALMYFKNNNIKFNLVFLDPPYNKDVTFDITRSLYEYDLLYDDALIVIEKDSSKIPLIDNFDLIKSKKYGDKYVFIMSRE